MGLFFDENGKVLPEYARPWWETRQAPRRAGSPTDPIGGRVTKGRIA
jgi:hypothetical protein